MSGIPKAYRIFEENGEVYLVREYIEGMSLAQMILQKGGISEAEICRISRKICQTAEQFQNPDEPMIHRDIKPENIVVTPGAEVVFIDFGTMRSYKKTGRVILCGGYQRNCGARAVWLYTDRPAYRCVCNRADNAVYGFREL